MVLSPRKIPECLFYFFGIKESGFGFTDGKGSLFFSFSEFFLLKKAEICIKTCENFNCGILKMFVHSSALF